MCVCGGGGGGDEVLLHTLNMTNRAHFPLTVKRHLFLLPVDGVPSCRDEGVLTTVHTATTHQWPRSQAVLSDDREATRGRMALE